MGLVFSPRASGVSWMRTHAQVPTPLVDERAGVIRVFFSSRPDRGTSVTSYVDLALDDPLRVVRISQEPILPLGKPGTFDEHGIMPSCIVRVGALVYLYYSGWSRSSTVPYTNSTGLAISEDGGQTFHRASDGPILAKSIHDPYSATSPCVVRTANAWTMWYCSGTDWVTVDGKYEHVYDIKRATSPDGIHWSSTGTAALEATGREEAITRPWVVRSGAGWRMWYCHRQAAEFRNGGEGSYHIAEAISTDMIHWNRVTSSVRGIGHEAWDRAMQAYPAVIEVENELMMFYNGRDFGADGFGVAVSDSHYV